MRTPQIVRPACDSATRQADRTAEWLADRLEDLDHGDIDGSCKAVIGQSLKRSCMHWTA